MKASLVYVRLSEINRATEMVKSLAHSLSLGPRWKKKTDSSKLSSGCHNGRVVPVYTDRK